MHKLVKEVIEGYKSKIIAVKRTEKDLITIQDLVPGARVWLDHEVNMSLVVTSMEEVKDILKLLAKNNIHLKEYILSKSIPIWVLKGEEVNIRFTPIWTHDEGAACRLIQVGENIYTTPIYKLVCDGEVEG